MPGESKVESILLNVSLNGLQLYSNRKEDLVIQSETIISPIGVLSVTMTTATNLTAPGAMFITRRMQHTAMPLLSL